MTTMSARHPGPGGVVIQGTVTGPITIDQSTRVTTTVSLTSADLDHVLRTVAQQLTPVIAGLRDRIGQLEQLVADQHTALAALRAWTELPAQVSVSDAGYTPALSPPAGSSTVALGPGTVVPSSRATEHSPGKERPEWLT